MTRSDGVIGGTQTLGSVGCADGVGVGISVGGGVGGSVGGGVGGSVGGSVGGAVGGTVGGCVGGTVGGSVGRTVGGTVGGSVGGTLGGMVGGTVGGFDGGTVGGGVGTGVGSAVGILVGSSVGSNAEGMDGAIVGLSVIGASVGACALRMTLVSAYTRDNLQVLTLVGKLVLIPSSPIIASTSSTMFVPDLSPTLRSLSLCRRRSYLC